MATVVEQLVGKIAGKGDELKDVVEEDLDSIGMTKLEKRRFLTAVAEL